MTKRDNLTQVQSCGIPLVDAITLRRIALTLHRWHEHECNGAIQRDGERGDGAHTGIRRTTAAGSIGRLIASAARSSGWALSWRGILTSTHTCKATRAALYILRPGGVPTGKDADAYYSRGIPVY